MLAFVKLQFALKIFGKIILKILYFGKDHRTDSNFIAPPRMHFEKSKSPLFSFYKNVV